MTGEPGRPGVRVGSSLIDMGTGMWAALGIVSALLERASTGHGTVVDTSLYETALGYIGYHLVGYLADGTVPTGQGTVFPMVAPYQVFPTRDGELMVAGGNDRLFALVCEGSNPVSSTTSASDEPRPRAQSGGARRARVGPPPRTRYRRLARAPDRRRRARGAGRRRRGRREGRSDAGVGTPPGRRPRGIPDLRLPALPLSFDRERATSARPRLRSASTRRRSSGRRLLVRRDRRTRARGVVRRGTPSRLAHGARLPVVQRDPAGAARRFTRNVARVAEAIGGAGGLLGAIDIVRVEPHHKVRDVTVSATNEDHLHRIADVVRTLDGIEVLRVSDRTFLMHLGGKIEMQSKVPLKTRDDLSMAYTPASRGSPRHRRRSRIRLEPHRKQNTVAVVSDGTAVLGLGDIGPEAAMPVMEGKAVLFKEFGGVDAWPLCLATRPGRDRRGLQGDRPGVRWDQPRGHLPRAASRSRRACGKSSTSPSSTTTSTAPRSSSSPPS